MASEPRLVTTPLESEHGLARRRLTAAGVAVLLVVGVGVGGYWLIGHGEWPLIDCVYMVVISVTTVGYGETLPIGASLEGRLFTLALIVVGLGVNLYFFSALTAFIIEGDLREVIWRRRMDRKLERLEGHYIVCGVGRTGMQVAEQIFQETGVLVAIDTDATKIEQLTGAHGDRIFGVLGDATADDVLRKAGVERARGIIAALSSDQDNLYVTLTARTTNPNLRIVSRGIDDRAANKLRQAGADAVVSPHRIGGRRMAWEILRPGLVGFVDLMDAEGENLDIMVVVVPSESCIAGKRLADSGIRDVTNALVLAVADADGGHSTFNPSPNFVIQAGMQLTVLAERHELDALRRHVGCA